MNNPGAGCDRRDTERRVAIVANRDGARSGCRQQSARQSETGGCNSDVPRGAAASSGRALPASDGTQPSRASTMLSIPATAPASRWRKDHPDRARGPAGERSGARRRAVRSQKSGLSGGWRKGQAERGLQCYS